MCTDLSVSNPQQDRKAPDEPIEYLLPGDPGYYQTHLRFFQSVVKPEWEQLIDQFSDLANAITACTRITEGHKASIRAKLYDAQAELYAMIGAKFMGSYDVTRSILRDAGKLDTDSGEAGQ